MLMIKPKSDTIFLKLLGTKLTNSGFSVVPRGVSEAARRGWICCAIIDGSNERAVTYLQRKKLVLTLSILDGSFTSKVMTRFE